MVDRVGPILERRTLVGGEVGVPVFLPIPILVHGDRYAGAHTLSDLDDTAYRDACGFGYLFVSSLSAQAFGQAVANLPDFRLVSTKALWWGEWVSNGRGRPLEFA